MIIILYWPQCVYATNQKAEADTVDDVEKIYHSLLKD